MGTPYKMKYTNGRKADPTAFPFNTMQQEQPTIESTQQDEVINNRVNQVVEKKVSSAIDEDVQTGDSAFKMMASKSPIKGVPLDNPGSKQSAENANSSYVKTPVVPPETKKNVELTPEEIEAAKKKAKRKAIGDVFVSSLTGGLDAVYGSGRVSSLGGTIKFSETKEEKAARLKKEEEAKNKIT